MEKNTACSVHYLIAAVVVGVVFDHRVMSVGGAKGNFNLTPGQCQVLETYHRFVDGFFVGLSPANKPKQAISKLEAIRKETALLRSCRMWPDLPIILVK
jgi:hypothetical protein